MAQGIRALIAGLFICLVGCGDTLPAAFVSVEGARFEGQLGSQGVRQFLGIAYAEPPVGDHRFGAAVPVRYKADAPVDIDATSFGPACPQDQGNPKWYRQVAASFGVAGERIPDLENISEDCLYLNIWAPAKADTALPVMVWVHGGSNVNGWAYEPNYRGQALAAKGVIVVSLNYRLGALGFMAHPLLTGEAGASGFYGISDQVAALQWVHANIGAFGGDPANVTLFGESAGGGNIVALMKSPAAVGLFHRAIIESGAIGPRDIYDSSEAEAAGAAMVAALGAKSAGDLRQLPWSAFVGLPAKAGINYYFSPVAGGPYVAGDKGYLSTVDVIVGSNANESLMYLQGSDAEALASARQRFADDPAVDAALVHGFANDRARADFLDTLVDFQCPALQVAKDVTALGGRAWLYRFSRVRDGGDTLKAYHGAEIPYVFDTHDSWLPVDDADRTLTTAMQDYWVSFAAAGVPNAEGRPQWENYKAGAPGILELGGHIAPTENANKGLCRYIKGE